MDAIWCPDPGLQALRVSDQGTGQQEERRDGGCDLGLVIAASIFWKLALTVSSPSVSITFWDL